jgi:hypothetical protein
MSNGNHIGDSNDMVVGDNDHGDRKPTLQMYRSLFFRIDLLTKERDAAIKERDEARREACERTAENLSLLGSNARLSTLREEHAARRGWDCFKEDETQ